MNPCFYKILLSFQALLNKILQNGRQMRLKWYKFTSYAFYWFSFKNRVIFLKMLWKGQSFYEIQIREKEKKQKEQKKMHR